MKLSDGFQNEKDQIRICWHEFTEDICLAAGSLTECIFQVFLVGFLAVAEILTKLIPDAGD